MTEKERQAERQRITNWLASKGLTTTQDTLKRDDVQRALGMQRARMAGKLPE